MAGGVGSRLWPLSKVSNPKQFIEEENSGKSFVQYTYERFSKIVPQDNIIVVTQSRYGSLMKQHLPGLKDVNLILEPYSRSTAPCIAYATYSLLKRDPLATVLVTPADHIIHGEEQFRADVLSALDYAAANRVLMTLGIVPLRPDTNFGYIQVSGGKAATRSAEPIKVKTFTEKPDKQMASIFFSSGEFLWNSGIFAWQADMIREELEKHMPEMTDQFKGWEEALGSEAERDFIRKAYGGCERTSIDYGLMEKTDKAWIFPAGFEWADIGAWDSFYSSFSEKDDDGNAIVNRYHISQDNSGTLIISTNKDKLIAVRGLNDFMVIDTPDTLLICPRNEKQFKSLTSGLATPEFEKFK